MNTETAATDVARPKPAAAIGEASRVFSAPARFLGDIRVPPLTSRLPSCLIFNIRRRQRPHANGPTCTVHHQGKHVLLTNASHMHWISVFFGAWKNFVNSRYVIPKSVK
ncbi:hypothetical protein MTO96_017060 [Rhipicephalus appendiculatus]